VDRTTWLRERRRLAEERYDTLHAPTYDQSEWATIAPTHHQFVARLIERRPPGACILDAACGTGKYFPMILEAGRRVVGTDQSAGMLAQARAKHPKVPLVKVGLQELAYNAEFDACMCVDAMEQVFPEDWPLVLGNLRRALRPDGTLYLTVELAEEQELERAFAEATASGLPVVHGEHTSPGGGYHYYPRPKQVAAWVRHAGLRLLEDGYDDEYYHLLAQAKSSPPALDSGSS
jgi:ubiquinone/menaquinone biosynthesis C-methylase UbiE